MCLSGREKAAGWVDGLVLVAWMVVGRSKKQYRHVSEHLEFGIKSPERTSVAFRLECVSRGIGVGVVFERLTAADVVVLPPAS